MVVSPIASGSLYTKLHQGFGDLLELGLVDGSRAAADRRPGRRVLAGRDRVRRRPRSVKPVRPRNDRSLARDRQPRRRRPRGRDGARDRAARSTPSPEEEVGENMALLAETTGVFGETAAG